jgi:hypothetical protein
MPSSAFTPDRRRQTAMRLAAQGITAHAGPGGRPSTPAEVVRSMLALQGQDLPGARWSIGLRGGDVTNAEVGAAFDAGEIVRSWPMRGTLHATSAEDIGWMLDLMAPRVVAATGTRRAELGITALDLERARDAAVASLGGGHALTRQALLAAIESGGVFVDGQRGYHLLAYLAQTGVIVLGPFAGSQHAFVLLEEWVSTPRRLDRDEALRELALRYFRSHGPATDRDLARWSGLPLGDVRRGLAACGNALARLEADGTTYLLAPEVLAAVRPPTTGRTAEPQAPVVRLLPGFDEYLLGYLDRSAALAPDHAQAVVPGNNGMFLPTIVADGEVIGTWKAAARAREVVIALAPFNHRLPAGVRHGLEDAAKRYGAFLGKPARVA